MKKKVLIIFSIILLGIFVSIWFSFGSKKNISKQSEIKKNRNFTQQYDSFKKDQKDLSIEVKDGIDVSNISSGNISEETEVNNVNDENYLRKKQDIEKLSKTLYKLNPDKDLSEAEIELLVDKLHYISSLKDEELREGKITEEKYNIEFNIINQFFIQETGFAIYDILYTPTEPEPIQPPM